MYDNGEEDRFVAALWWLFDAKDKIDDEDEDEEDDVEDDEGGVDEPDEICVEWTELWEVGIEWSECGDKGDSANEVAGE